MRFRPELALLRSQLRGLARHGYALGGEIGPTLHSLGALIDVSRAQRERERERERAREREREGQGERKRQARNDQHLVFLLY